MATYGNMQARIADELDRSDLLPQIQNAIVTSIKVYQRRNFWFNERSFQFSTVVGQEYYGATDNAQIASSPNLQILRLQYGGGVRWELPRQTFEEVDQLSASRDWRGVPEVFAYRGEEIRLYPIPSQVWPIDCFNIYRIPDPPDNSDSSEWFNEAEELIRTAAKIDLLINVIRPPNLSDELAGLLAQKARALGDLTGETGFRESWGAAVPTAF